MRVNRRVVRKEKEAKLGYDAREVNKLQEDGNVRSPTKHG